MRMKKLHNKQLYNLYYSLHVAEAIKLKIM
jgi:hypothetical protein